MPKFKPITILLVAFTFLTTLGLAISLQGVLGINITSDLNLGLGKKITGLPVPTGNTEAANKEYIDSQVGAIAAGSGASYTGYGITSCAAGWTAAYTGVAMSLFMAGNTGAGGSSTVCKQGSEFAIGPGTVAGTYWVTGSPWGVGLNRYLDSFVSCVVCVK